VINNCRQCSFLLSRRDDVSVTVFSSSVNIWEFLNEILSGANYVIELGYQAAGFLGFFFSAGFRFLFNCGFLVCRLYNFLVFFALFFQTCSSRLYLVDESSIV